MYKVRNHVAFDHHTTSFTDILYIGKIVGFVDVFVVIKHPVLLITRLIQAQRTYVFTILYLEYRHINTIIQNIALLRKLNKKLLYHRKDNPMTSETADITKLYDIILQLTQKIDGLENKIDLLTSQVQSGGSKHSTIKKNLIYTPDYVPALDFDGWVQTCEIRQEHVNAIFKGTILEGFKYFINDWFSEQIQSGEALPVVVLGSGKTKLLYVYEDTAEENPGKKVEEPGTETVDPGSDEDGEKSGKWVLISEQTIHQFIASIWRKMLEYYFTCETEPDVDETVRDINKKKLIDMRKGLVEKHVREIERSIVKVLQK